MVQKKKLNPMYKPVEQRLFEQYLLVAAGIAEMKEKLGTYAQNQLPGEPEPAIKVILKEIKPSNDLCESILGLNDYLTTAIPNMHQTSR